MENSTFGSIYSPHLKKIRNSDIPGIALSTPLKPSFLNVPSLSKISVRQAVKRKERDPISLLIGGREAIYSKQELFRIGLMKAWAENKDVLIFDPKA